MWGAPRRVAPGWGEGQFVWFPLLPRPVRLALGQEGFHAFLEVLRRVAGHDQVSAGARAGSDSSSGVTSESRPHASISWASMSRARMIRSFSRANPMRAAARV